MWNILMQKGIHALIIGRFNVKRPLQTDGLPVAVCRIWTAAETYLGREIG
jgi:hypothetical protein